MVMKKYPSLLSTQGDKEEAIYSGLLNMGANMGGYSKTPISFMNRLSQAGQNFGTGYQDRIAQSKKDQLGDLEYQKMMGQMEAQQLALADAATKRDAKISYLNMPEASLNTRADGSGATKLKMFERAYPDLVAKQKAKSTFPTAAGGRAASGLQYFDKIQKIRSMPDGPLKNRMLKDLSESMKISSNIDLGATIQRPNPLDSSEPTTLTKTVPIEKTPEQARLVSEQKAIGTKTGAEEGDAIAKLSAMKAAYPRLTSAVTKLKDLGKIATYSWKDRATDALTKESGGKPTQGAVARAEYIARVKNNILPLLKSTFGAAFTATEGDSLLATLGDPNMHPDEKEAVLNAFIEGKAAEIGTLQRQTGGAPAKKTIKFDTQGNIIP